MRRTLGPFLVAVACVPLAIPCVTEPVPSTTGTFEEQNHVFRPRRAEQPRPAGGEAPSCKPSPRAAAAAVRKTGPDGTVRLEGIVESDGSAREARWSFAGGGSSWS